MEIVDDWPTSQPRSSACDHDDPHLSFRVQLTASSNRQPRYWTPEFLHLGHELHKCSPQCCSTPPMHYHSYSPLPSLLGCLRRTRTFTCCNSYSGVSLNYLRSALKTKSKESKEGQGVNYPSYSQSLAALFTITIQTIMYGDLVFLISRIFSFLHEHCFCFGLTRGAQRTTFP